jgi:gamma-glutamylcyclotransferase (GGCT)/AIG2-like uncharacterized protein YtfP
MSEILKVFVYGTLKPGEVNYDYYCREQVLSSQAAFVFGQLYDLPFGYPAMSLATSELLTAPDRSTRSIAYGFVLTFAEPEVLTLLDELEDYEPNRSIEQNEYIRVETEAFTLEQQSLGQVWVYQMELQLIEKLGGIFLPQGKWHSGLGQTK